MKKIVALFLIFSFMLSGCAKEDIPELLAPAKSIDATYTVSKGTINNKNILDGYVVPATETVYFETAGQAYDVKYRPGDVVKAGDVIITLNEGIDEEVEKLSSELSQYLTVSECYVAQHTEEINSMNSILASKSGMEYDLYEIEIKSRQTEYNRFEQQRADEYEVLTASYNELLDKQANSVITAPCDGTIVYTGVTSEGGYATDGSVALVIADETQKIVCFDYYDSEFLSSVDELYIQIGDTNYDDFSFIEYSQEEIDYNSQYGYKMYTRAVINNLPAEVEFGTYCAVHMTYDQVDDVVFVPNEAVFYDAPNHTDYCLVYNDDGTQSRVPVKTGIETRYYTEITDGLSEGQVIFYAEDQAAWASGIETTEVFLGDYSHTMTFSGAYKHAMISEELVITIPGTVSEVFLENTNDVEVEEGTPLFSIIPSIEQSVYEKAKLDYNTAVESYDASIAEYDNLIAAKQDQLNNSVSNVDKTIAQYEYDTLVAQKNEFVESLDENIAKLEADLAVYETCVNGEEVVITAPCSGTLYIDMTLTKAEISKDQVIGRIDDTDSYICYVSDYDSGEEKEGFLQYGNDVIISSDAGTISTTGVVYGASQLVANGRGESVGIRLDNDADSVNVSSSTATVTVKDVNISNVVLIDSEYVHTDEQGLNYVLLKQGDFYVKRVIEVARTSTTTFTWVKSGLDAGDICVRI